MEAPEGEHDRKVMPKAGLMPLDPCKQGSDKLVAPASRCYLNPGHL